MASESESDGVEGAIKVIRGRVDSLSLYEVTDSELRTLERGSPNSIYLNFAVFLLSTGASFLISILTATIEPIELYVAFLVVTCVSFVVGLVLLALWWRNRGSVQETIQDIKRRIPSSEVVKVPDEKSG